MEILEQAITELYKKTGPNRTAWADWLGANHIFLVADTATQLARRYNANEELARAGGMLHDVADAVMSRFDPEHGEESLKSARILMRQAGFSDKEIRITVDDAIRLHSCHDGQLPESLEGKSLEEVNPSPA